MTPYQETIVTDFLMEAFKAYRDQVGQLSDTEPLDSTDEDLNEFVDQMTGFFVVPMHIPIGKTRAEYVADLREAMHLFFKELDAAGYDTQLQINIDLICDYLE